MSRAIASMIFFNYFYLKLGLIWTYLDLVNQGNLVNQWNLVNQMIEGSVGGILTRPSHINQVLEQSVTQ